MFYMENGDTAKAIKFFDESRKITPNDKDLAYYHAVLLGLAGHIDESLARFKEAIALDPDDAQSYFAAYSICRDAGRFEDAATFLQMWLARHPDDVQAQGLLAQLHVGGAPMPDSAPGSIAPPGGPGGGGVPGGLQ